MLAPWMTSYDKPTQCIYKETSLCWQRSIQSKLIFPVLYSHVQCDSSSIKMAECWRIDAFELWCWRRLFRVPWTARRSNQSTLKEISPEYSLEWLMLKLELQYFGHLMQKKKKKRLIWKDPDAQKDWRQEEKGMIEDKVIGWHHQLDWHEFEQPLEVGEGQGSLVCCSP